MEDKEIQHAIAKHAGSKLLLGQADRGALRAANPAAFKKFQDAAKTVAVTREVLDMLHCCQDELRQAQSDYKESKLLPSQSPPDSKQQQQQQGGSAAAAKSAKARQNEAVSAADAAATYSLRSVERGRVDPTATTATPQQKPTGSAVAADWGFLKNVDRLQAAPAAAAAKMSPAGLPRAEQPYLSADAATKAAHQAWQPEEAATWRKVLTAKKTRQANKSQIEEAERERAASFIQARWMLHQHQKQQQQLKEQQLTSWAEQHYAAAAAARMSVTPEASTKQLPAAAAAGPDSDDDESTSTASSAEQQQQQQEEEEVEARRRIRTRVSPEAAARPAKPAVQPWSRMVGREAPINTTTTTTNWRGAAAGAMAASKLAALAAAAGDEGGLRSPRAAAAAEATGSGPEEEPPGLLMQEVAPMTSGDGTAADGLSRTSSSVPLGVKVARTSSTAAALAHKGSTLLSNLTALFRTKSSTGGTDGAALGTTGSSSSGSRGSSSAGGVQGGAPTGVSLTKRLSMDLAAFFTGHGTHKARDSLADSSAASKPATTHVTRRGSLDLGGLFGRSGGSGGASGDSHNEAAAAAAGGGRGPPLAPTPPARRSSVEFVRSLFRRSSVDLPAPAPDTTPTAAAAAVRGGGGDRTAPGSRFITAESCEPSQLPSPLLSGCATARTSWTDTAKDESAAAAGAAGGAASPDLAACGAAAAAAYLDAASRALVSREAVMSLCGGIPPQGPSAEQQAGALQGRSTGREDFSLSGGIAGACRSSVVFAAGAAGPISSVADGEEAAAAGFESIWSKITTASTGGNGDRSSSNRGAAAADQHHQQQQQQSHEPKQRLQAAAASEQPQGQPQPRQPSGGAPRADSSSRSNSRQAELQPGKPKVVGQGEVGFQPNKAVLLTAADITSSSFYKQSGTTSSSKAPATSKAPTAADASSSSLYKSTAHPHQAPPEPDAVPATAVGPAVAASSSLYALGNQRGPSPASVTIGESLLVQLPTAATSPSASPGTSSPQSPASPMHPQQRVWSPKAPQPPRAPSGSSSSRPGPRPQMFVRQGGLKSIDLAADVAAALARPGAAAEDTTAPSARTPPPAAAAAAASPLDTTAKGPPTRPPSAGMSSVSQKLAVARRMAATAAADADESSSPTAFSLQLDGSKSTVSRKSIAQPDQVLVKSTGPSGSSSSSSPPPASIPQGVTSRKAVDFAPLRPTAAAAAGRPGVAWAPDSSIRTGPTGGSGDLNTHITANFLGGRGSPDPSAHPQAISAPDGKSAKGTSAAGSGLPNLIGHRRDGSDSPVSANAMSGKGPKLAVGRNAGGSAVLGISKDKEGTKPRRNSYSNDGSNPNSAADPGRGGLAVAGGKLRPTSGAKGGDQPDHLKRLSLL